MRAVVNNRKCQGFGICKLAAPELFEVGEADGYAIVLKDPIPLSQADDAESAARQCPMEAIELLGGR